MIKGDFKLDKMWPSKGDVEHEQSEAVGKRNKGDKQ